MKNSNLLKIDYKCTQHASISKTGKILILISQVKELLIAFLGENQDKLNDNHYYHKNGKHTEIKKWNCFAKLSKSSKKHFKIHHCVTKLNK